MRTWIRDPHSPSGEAQKYWQRRSLRMTLGLVGLVVLTSIAILPASGFAATSEKNANLDPVIKILIYNMAQAPGPTLTEAEHEAGRILSEAGVHVIWVECSAGHSDAGSQTCQDGWGSINIGLRILVKPNSFADRLHSVPLGFAIFPALASVYYDHRLRFLGDDRGLGLPRVLGCFMAHEIGHLLLGPNRHADQGLMRQGGERDKSNRRWRAICGSRPIKRHSLKQKRACEWVSRRVPMPIVAARSFAFARRLHSPSRTRRSWHVNIGSRSMLAGCSSRVTDTTRRHTSTLSLPIRERRRTYKSLRLSTTMRRLHPIRRVSSTKPTVQVREC
jgi:hypothetical protein